MATKLHFVAFCRDGHIESILQVTRSLTLAQQVLLDALKKIDPQEAKDTLKDFADETLTNNVCILLKDDLVLQQFTCVL